MSTNINQRIKKLSILLFAVSIIATIGLVVVQAQVNQNKIVNTQNNSYITIDSFEEDFALKMKKNSISERNSKDNIEVSSVKGTATSKSVPLNYFSQYEKATVVATGYTAGVESTGKDETHPAYGITFSGSHVCRDVYSTIAADISVFPLGTILYIPDYGYGVVADTGSAIIGNKIDLYYDTVEQVYEQWGKKEVEVYIIEYGNGAVCDSTIEEYNRVATATNQM